MKTKTFNEPTGVQVAEVFETYNYSMFEPLKGNRAINPIHLKRITESIKNNYLLSPILINEKGQIIDGQHRFKSAKDLGLPIRYIVAVRYGLKEVQVLKN